MKYAALLRGINVGGHHKVPMADLKKCLEDNGYKDIKTLLNSGNAIFSSDEKKDPDEIRIEFESFLAAKFGFPIPVFILPASTFLSILNNEPFREIRMTPDTRNYVTFFRDIKSPLPDLPWKSDDGSFQILDVFDNVLISSLDISITKTPDAMKVLGLYFGKDITTRNWNTMEKVGKLMK